MYEYIINLKKYWCPSNYLQNNKSEIIDAVKRCLVLQDEKEQELENASNIEEIIPFIKAAMLAAIEPDDYIALQFIYILLTCREKNESTINATQ